MLREEGNPRILPGKSLSRGGPNRGQLTRALTIPLSDAKTALGVTRQGRVASEKGVSAFGPLAVIFFKNRRAQFFGKLVTGYMSPETGEMVPYSKELRTDYFLLARWIAVKAKPYLAPSLEEFASNRREKILLEAMRRATDVSAP